MILCPECHDGLVIVHSGRSYVGESCYCGRLWTWTVPSGDRIWLLRASCAESFFDTFYVALLNGTLWKGDDEGSPVKPHGESDILMRAVPVPAGQEDAEVEEVVRLMSATDILES